MSTPTPSTLLPAPHMVWAESTIACARMRLTRARAESARALFFAACKDRQKACAWFLLAHAHGREFRGRESGTAMEMQVESRRL